MPSALISSNIILLAASSALEKSYKNSYKQGVKTNVAVYPVLLPEFLAPTETLQDVQMRINLKAENTGAKSIAKRLR